MTDEVSKLEKESERKASFPIKADNQERILIIIVDRYFLVGQGMLSSTHEP